MQCSMPHLNKIDKVYIDFVVSIVVPVPVTSNNKITSKRKLAKID